MRYIIYLCIIYIWQIGYQKHYLLHFHKMCFVPTRSLFPFSILEVNNLFSPLILGIICYSPFGNSSSACFFVTRRLQVITRVAFFRNIFLWKSCASQHLSGYERSFMVCDFFVVNFILDRFNNKKTLALMFS